VTDSQTESPSPTGAASRGRVLVLGLGNVLLADDGIGPAAVSQIEQDYRIPSDVRLVDGGTLGLALLDEIAEARHLILVDAVATGGTPGAPVRLEGAEMMDAVRDRLSPHQVGVVDLLNAARLIGRYPDSVVLLGLVPGAISLSLARTRAVEDAINTLVSAIVRELATLGYALAPQSSVPAHDRAIHALTRHFGM
jgi:hydrogenase maturation protease